MAPLQALGICQDVWGVHGMGGFIGTVLLGVLADPEECGASAAVAPSYCVNPGGWSEVVW